MSSVEQSNKRWLHRKYLSVGSGHYQFWFLTPHSPLNHKESDSSALLPAALRNLPVCSTLCHIHSHGLLTSSISDDPTLRSVCTVLRLVRAPPCLSASPFLPPSTSAGRSKFLLLNLSCIKPWGMYAEGQVWVWAHVFVWQRQLQPQITERRRKTRGGGGPTAVTSAQVLFFSQKGKKQYRSAWHVCLSVRLSTGYTPSTSTLLLFYSSVLPIWSEFMRGSGSALLCCFHSALLLFFSLLKMDQNQSGNRWGTSPTCLLSGVNFSCQRFDWFESRGGEYNTVFERATKWSWNLEGMGQFVFTWWEFCWINKFVLPWKRNSSDSD